MTDSLKDYLKKAIDISFLALAVATPFIFTTQTTELFEVPKMFFVYFVAVLLFFLAATKSLIEKKVTFPKGPVTIALGIFLATQIASAVTSTDKYLSIFGYPTRLNGGMLSLFAYSIIFVSVLTQLGKAQARKILLASVAAATAVSIWGIPSHFGFDPSCLVLTGQPNSTCWAVDFNPTLRIFSTLGQPNWLASYLVLVLPLSLANLIIYKSKNAKFFFLATSAIIFIALVLTTSRAGILGAAASLFIFAALVGIKVLKTNLKVLAAIFAIFIFIWLVFGTALTSRITQALNAGKSQFNSSQTSSQSKTKPPAPITGGTESSAIRFIVWQGALKVFEKWPILGSGPETIVNSYYLYRPLAHNQTTEWKFFYNKAHNEFLNYLASSGIVGFAGFAIFLLVVFRQLAKKAPDEKSGIIAKAVTAAFIGYLVTIFFGFSTVATQTAFFLIAACALVIQEGERFKIVNLRVPKASIIALMGITAILSLYFLTFILRLALSDTLKKRAESYEETSPSRALIIYDNATTVSPITNPYITSSFAYFLATYIASESDTPSQKLENRTDSLAIESANTSPNNFLITTDLAKTYLLLAQTNPKFENKALEVAQKLPKMAPTYPVSYYTLAKTQIALGQETQAKASFKKALQLKPDYLDAKELLDQIPTNP